MSKSDKFTAAATAIAVAVGFLVGGPVWGVICLIIGIVFLVSYFQHDSDDLIVTLGDISPVESGPPQFDAERYIAQKKAVDSRFLKLSHGTREALSLLSLMGPTTAQNITAHLVKFEFPAAERVFDDLRNDSVSFVVSAGTSEFELNPTLATIIREAVKEDESHLLAQEETLSGDEFKYKIDHDPGYAARYNAIKSKK